MEPWALNPAPVTVARREQVEDRATGTAVMKAAIVINVVIRIVIDIILSHLVDQGIKFDLPRVWVMMRTRDLLEEGVADKREREWVGVWRIVWSHFARLTQKTRERERERNSRDDIVSGSCAPIATLCVICLRFSLLFKDSLLESFFFFQIYIIILSINFLQHWRKHTHIDTDLKNVCVAQCDFHFCSFSSNYIPHTGALKCVYTWYIYIHIQFSWVRHAFSNIFLNLPNIQCVFTYIFFVLQVCKTGVCTDYRCWKAHHALIFQSVSVCVWFLPHHNIWMNILDINFFHFYLFGLVFLHFS